MTVRKADLPLKKISEICRTYQVRELSVFGSYLREDFGPGSDIDLLVEFAADAEIGFLSLSRMSRELSGALNLPVDLVPKSGLKPKIRDEVLSGRTVLYAA